MTSSDRVSSQTTEPARPTELVLDGVDACALFDSTIISEFHLRGEVMPQTTSTGQSACQMLTGPPGGYVIWVCCTDR